MITPNLSDVQLSLQNLSQRLQNALSNRLNAYHDRLKQFSYRLSLSSPLNRVNIARQRLDEFTRHLELHLSHDLQQKHSKLALLAHRLESLNPATILERGYAMLLKPDGEIVRTIAQIQVGDFLQARLKDGHFDTRVESVTKEG
jgi:exodeoxyribonuclease VII large subunit